MSNIDYTHAMAAHCESGTVRNLLNFNGLDISEPLVFGIAGGLFFGYMKTPMREFPMVISRIRPGRILDNFSKRSGIKFIKKTYSNPEKAEQELDELLAKGIPVGLQVDFFYMEFFPPWHRVHINVHYIVVIGKEGDHYLVSDAYHPTVARLHRDALRKGRFAKGSMAPKGLMFRPVDVPQEIPLEEGIQAGLKSTLYNMLKIPLPFLGVKGIRRFADKLPEWRNYTDDEELLAHNIFMITTILEDQGTGGGGFRYVYASFLHEAATILKNPVFKEYAGRMMAIGDDWRKVSLHASRIAKKRELGKNSLEEMGGLIRKNAEREYAFFTDLRNTMAS